MHKLLKTLNKFSGNLCFAGSTDFGDCVFECNYQSHVITYDFSTKFITDVCPMSSNSYSVAFSDQYIGKYSNSVLTENFIDTVTISNIDKIVMDTQSNYYILNRISNQLIKYNNGVIWIFSLPDYSLRTEGNIVLRESDGNIIYYNNTNLHMIRDDVINAVLLNSLEIDGIGDLAVVIGNEFKPTYIYMRARTVTGSELDQSSSSSVSSSSSSSSSISSSSSSSISSFSSSSISSSSSVSSSSSSSSSISSSSISSSSSSTEIRSSSSSSSTEIRSSSSSSTEIRSSSSSSSTEIGSSSSSSTEIRSSSSSFSTEIRSSSSSSSTEVRSSNSSSSTEIRSSSSSSSTEIRSSSSLSISSSSSSSVFKCLEVTGLPSPYEYLNAQYIWDGTQYNHVTTLGVYIYNDYPYQWRLNGLGSDWFTGPVPTISGPTGEYHFWNASSPIAYVDWCT